MKTVIKVSYHQNTLLY